MNGDDVTAVRARHTLVLFVVVSLVGVLLISVGVGSVAGQSAPDCSTVTYNGDGTVSNPYKVGNIDQLQCIETQGLDASYEVVSDIDASETPSWNSGKGFEPIGQGTAFTGNFDGQGHEITDLTIDRDSEFFVGLFGIVEMEGNVIDTSVVDADITGDRLVGGLVGDNRGTVSKSYMTGSVGGVSIYVGGLVGKNSGMINNSHATVSVSAKAQFVGGLVGRNIGTIEKSYATGSVVSDDGVGGLIGKNDGIVSDSHATAAVNGSYGVGGLVGENDDTVRKSYAEGDVTASGGDTGGLVGDNDGGLIERSYATGDVDGTRQTGGLVGENDDESEVSESYATGSVSGSGAVGGFVGDNRGMVSNSYSTGLVEGTEEEGGLVGTNEGKVRMSYWDVETTQQSTSDGGTGLTTIEMTGSAARSNMDGFDFTSIWEAVTSSGDYPILRWQSDSGGGEDDYTAQNGVAYHNGFAYVVDDGDVVKIDWATGDVVNRFAAPDGRPDGLAHDGESLWFADGVRSNFDGEIVELNPDTGSVRSVIETSYDPTGLAY